MKLFFAIETILSVAGFFLFQIPVYAQQKDTINLYFAFNKYQLNTYHRVELNTLLDKYSEVTHVSITGHADTTGPPQYNMELSRKRAVSVKNYLFEIGLDTLIRDFNYYGEGKAIMPVRATDRSSSLGGGVLSDRRVETIAGGKPISINPEIPPPLKEELPESKVINDNIPPVITPVNNPVIPSVPLIHSKLKNGVELTYTKKAFPDFIDNKISRGDESLIYLIDNINSIKQNNMTTVTEDGRFLSPAEIVCFDSLTFTDFHKDTAITIKIPLNNSIDCPEGKIKFYTAVSRNGSWQWSEQPETPPIEKNNGWYYVTMQIHSFHGCMNFAYEIQSPCFSPALSALTLKDITISQIQASVSNINCVYIPVRKENGDYEIFQNQKEGSNLFFDFVARDKKNKIYNLRNFPVTMCKYDPAKNTYTLTKKDLQRFIKNY